MHQVLGAVIDPKRLDAALDFLTWDQKGKTVFDVQYQPLIQNEGRCFVPLSILGYSNLIRNAIKLSGRRPESEFSKEPVSRYIKLALERHTPEVKEGIEFYFGGEHGEIDVIALLGNTLFVFEIKHSLHPAGFHELRTSWDHVEPAAQQLTKIRTLLADQNFCQYLGNRIGFSLDGASRVETGIIVSNRMFHGYRLAGHPVRGAFDFGGFLKTGLISVGQEKRCLWKGNAFTGEDLVAYLSDDVTLKPLWDAMEPFDKVFQIGDRAVRVSSFNLCLIKAAENLGFHETARELREQVMRTRTAASRQTSLDSNTSRVFVQKSSDLRKRRMKHKDMRLRKKRNRP